MLHLKTTVKAAYYFWWPIMKNLVSTLVKSCQQCHPCPASRLDKLQSQPCTSPTTPVPSSSVLPCATLTDTEERLLTGLCPPSPPLPPDQPQPDAQPRPGPLPPLPLITLPCLESSEDFDQLVTCCMSFHDEQADFILDTCPTFSLINA